MVEGTCAPVPPSGSATEGEKLVTAKKGYGLCKGLILL